jgi:hypothetical protein
MHIRQNNAGKTASVYIKNGKCLYFYNGVPELSLALLSLTIYSTQKMRSENLFYLRGSSSASLQVHLPYSITINGLSSPASGSRSQPIYIKADLSNACSKARLPWLTSLSTLNYIQFQIQMRLRLSFSFECMRADVAGWLAGWHGAMLLHQKSSESPHLF